MEIALGNNEWTYNNNKYTLNVRRATGTMYIAILWKAEKTSDLGSATPIILQSDKTYTALEQPGTYNVKTTRVNINNTNRLDITAAPGQRTAQTAEQPQEPRPVIPIVST